METEKIIDISSTQRGYPALWEMGGATSDLEYGSSRVIADTDKKPMPFVTLSRSKTVNGEHCLIVIHPGDHIVECKMKSDEHWIDFKITEWKIVAILLDFKAKVIQTDYLETSIQNDENAFESIIGLPEHFVAAMKISMTPNCKKATYVDWNVMDSNLARKILNEEGEVLFSKDRRFHLDDPKEVIKNIFRCNSYNEAEEVAKKTKVNILLLEDIPYGLRRENGKKNIK